MSSFVWFFLGLVIGTNLGFVFLGLVVSGRDEPGNED